VAQHKSLRLILVNAVLKLWFIEGKSLLTRRTAVITLRSGADWCVALQKSHCFMRTKPALLGNYIDTCLFVHYHNYVHGIVLSTFNAAKKKTVFNEAYAVSGHGASLVGT
jgi:hypothetical protein